MANLNSVLKSKDITLPTEVCIVKATVFPVVMYGCESWTIKKTKHWWIAFELWRWRRLETPLDSKEIKPVNPKGNQHWIFIGRTDAEAKAPILWLPDVNNWLTGKDLIPGKTEDRQRGWAEDVMVGWHHWLNGYESEQTPEDGGGQRSLACCSPWDHKETQKQSNKASIKNPKGWDSDCFWVGEHVEGLRGWLTKRGLETPCFFPHILL